MKTILYLLILISFSNCNNRKESVFKAKKIVNTKTETFQVKNKEANSLKIDTLTKKSEPFTINGIKCYWVLTLLIKEGNNDDSDGKLVLKDKQSAKVLLINSDYYDLDDSYYTNSFKRIDFESLNEDAIKDINFDGYKDFMIYGKTESGSAGMFYKVYLFNNEKKIFEQSELLSGYNIAIDTINKSISTSAKNGFKWNISRTHHLSRKGKIEYTEITEREVISEEPSLLKTTYKKTIGEEIVKTKIDTTRFEGW